MIIKLILTLLFIGLGFGLGQKMAPSDKELLLERNRLKSKLITLKNSLEKLTGAELKKYHSLESEDERSLYAYELTGKLLVFLINGLDLNITQKNEDLALNWADGRLNKNDRPKGHDHHHGPEITTKDQEKLHQVIEAETLNKTKKE